MAVRMLPKQVYCWCLAFWRGHEYRSPLGKVSYGRLRRVALLSREFGFNQRHPINHYCMERFLVRQADDIQGRVLGIGDNSYTRQPDGSRVTTSDVPYTIAADPKAT